MKKTFLFSLYLVFFSFVANVADAASIMNSQPVSAYSSHFTTQDAEVSAEFLTVYQQALKLNEKRFNDLNVIQVGDTILFPARNGYGTEAWVADTPMNNKHDCIWRLTRKYLAGQLVTTPIKIVNEPVAKENPKQIVSKTLLDNPTIWFILLLILVVAMLILVFLIVYALMRRFDPNRHAVITNGLDNEPIIALQQLNAAYPNRPRAIRIQRGIVRAPIGVSFARVFMTFSNGQKITKLKSGELVYRVEREGGIVDFYRQHCGNLFGEVFNGDYNLPVGWTFTNILSANAAPTPAPAPAPLSSAANPVEEIIVLDEQNDLDADDIVKIIAALKKANLKPEAIDFGSIQILFYKDKKKKK